MMVACIAEHLDTAKWLLSKFKYQVCNRKFVYVGNSRNTCLVFKDISRLFHLAAQTDCAKLVDLLISFGADCETLDQVTLRSCNAHCTKIFSSGAALLFSLLLNLDATTSLICY